MDLIIRNVVLKDRQYRSFDIGIMDGLVSKISHKISESAEQEVDGNGGLATPNFVDSHSHLDKIDMIYQSPPAITGTLLESFARAGEAKRKSSVPDVAERVTKGIRAAIANGTGGIRVHSEVDTTWGLTGIKGLLEVRNKFGDIFDLQIIPLPTENPLNVESKELVREAMELGADGVGGSPHLEYVQPDVFGYVDFVFDIAKEYNVPVDLHVDQDKDPTAYTRSLEYILVKTLREGFEGKVTVNHCGAIALYEDSYRARIINLMKRAEVSFVMCPKEELIISSLCSAPIREIFEAQVNCGYAHNNCADTFSPYGRLDMVNAGFLAIHAGGFRNINYADDVLDMGTINTAKILGLDYSIQEGNKAHINVFKAESAYELFRQGESPRAILRHGKLVAENQTSSILHID